MTSRSFTERPVQELGSTTVFAKHPRRYGAPRIAKTLQQEGLPCSENRIARRMGALNLQAIQAKKFKVTTDSQHSNPVAPDRLKQDFSAATPNQKWTTDITYVWTDEGGGGGVAFGCRDGPVLTSYRRVGNEPPNDATPGL